MTKADLIKGISEKAEITPDQAKKALNAALEGIMAAVCADDKVQIAGFGTFEVHTRTARSGRNPATGETIEIAESKSPVFKAGKAFKDLVKG